ncbi:MAG: hypothetical protein ACM3UU_05305 [Ignavibacteriales bacterium]
MDENSFLDYAKNLMLDFNFSSEGQISYVLESLEKSARAENLQSNLKKIIHIEKLDQPGLYGFYIGSQLFARISPDERSWSSVNKLTSFETRLLAQGKNTNGVPFDRSQKPSFVPQTDLHTHFAGVLPTDKLIELGLKHNINYPARDLQKFGIDISKFSKTGDEKIPLSELMEDEEAKRILTERLSISTCKQETFNKMEEVYTARGPFTKNKELFEDSLMEIAKAYAENGTKYVELSHSAIISDLDYLETIHKKMPEIEAQIGVKVRFLAALWRHSDKEWNADEVDRIKTVAQSPYVVGCDFMGHETNPTESFAGEITSLAEWAMENDPDFVIRVHAGENPIFQDNVKTTLLTIKQAYEEKKKTNDSVKIPRIRIGHGLYGVDEETLALAGELGAVIEFNMSSNLSLNNINNIQDVPIQKYLETGVDVVLGSDGFGIYGTSGEVEALLANTAGVSDFGAIDKKEQEIIALADKRFSEKEASLQNELSQGKTLRDVFSSTVYKNGNPVYTQEVEQMHKKELEELHRYLASKIEHTNAITEPYKIEEAIHDKLPILITGASKSSWPNISTEHQQQITELMRVLVDVVNPEKAYFVTGGTNHGVEKELHQAANERNKSSNNQLVVLGTFTQEAANDATNDVEKDTITHAQILTLDGRIANTWYDLPDAVLSFVQERDGEMVAIGGGGVVRDMIQRAHNMNDIGISLMNGPAGASTDKSEILAGEGYDFGTAEELLVKLYDKHPEIFSEKIKEYLPNIGKQALQPYSTFSLNSSMGEHEAIMAVVNAVRSSNENPDNTIFYFDEESYAGKEPHILKSIKQVAKMIESNGGKAFSSEQKKEQYILENPNPPTDMHLRAQKSVQKENRLFLGGTCNNDMWREEDFTPMLGKISEYLGVNIEYYNPVVADWTPECMQEEIKQREVCSNVLYAVTEKAQGYYSYAEVIDDACKRPDRTLFCYLSDRPLTEEQKTSYQEIAAIVEEKGGKSFSSLSEVAKSLYIEKAKDTKDKTEQRNPSVPAYEK